MTDRLNRRDFLVASAAASLAAAAPRTLFGEAAAVIVPKGGKPVVVASANGNVFKNGGDMTGVQKAFTLMTQGADVLDALVAGVNILELDPEEDPRKFSRYKFKNVVSLASPVVRRSRPGIGHQTSTKPRAALVSAD